MLPLDSFDKQIHNKKFMKKFSIMFLLAAASIHLSSAANDVYSSKIAINFDKVVHIILPTQVEMVSAGSSLIEATIVPEAQNIVRVLALEEKFADETNVTIVDKAGQMYTYQVAYNDDSSHLASVFYPLTNVVPEEKAIKINSQNKAFVVFPSEIVYIKEGNENSINLTLTSAKNIVQIGTDLKEFSQTNFFAVDKNGKEYNILVECGKADNYVYNLKEVVQNKKETTSIAAVENNSTNLEKLADKGIHTTKKIYYIGITKNGVVFSIDNIFVNDEYMMFIITIKNNSNINYDIDFMKYFFVDKKVTKNAVQQELAQEPINLGKKYSYSTIEGNSQISYPLLFKKFTIPDDKYLRIEIFEKGGGRHIYFNTSNKDIMKATKF